MADTVKVHVTLFPDPIEVRPDEVDVLRAQGLLREPTEAPAPAPTPAVAALPAVPAPEAAPAKLTKEKGA